MEPKLEVVMYHYVRDLPASAYPRLKGMLLSDFRQQVTELRREYEMATLESALAFLEGTYTPHRNLCLLTFDDGLREHYADVAPLLAEQRIAGLFFLITECLEHGRVAPVHMNHFLMASMDFSEYRRQLWARIAELDSRGVPACDAHVARQAYSWDSEEVAQFKYVFNFLLDPALRDVAVAQLFEERIGPEAEFSSDLYLSWTEARQMQDWGMVMGGHSHQHRPLAALSACELSGDLGECRRLLSERLSAQMFWPFCYPYGRRHSFTPDAVSLLRALGFSCAFSTEAGANQPGEDRFALRRTDCKRAGVRGNRADQFLKVSA